MDSSVLSCITSQDLIIHARYLSPTRMVCLVSGNVSASMQGDFAITASNNGRERSERSVLIRVESANKVVQAIPLAGFVDGGTLIVIDLSLPALDPPRCAFASSLTSPSYQRSETSFVCVSPPHDSGPAEVRIMVGASQVGVLLFEYFALPVVASVFPNRVAASELTEVVISTNSTVPYTGRVRDDSGTSVDGNCSSVSLGATSCWLTASPLSSHTYIDLSVNGVDYVENSVSLGVFKLTSIAMLESAVWNTGASELLFAILSPHSQESSVCVFENSEATETRPLTEFRDGLASCVCPLVDIRLRTTVTVLQSSYTVFGPVALNVEEPPEVTFVAPLVLAADQEVHLRFTLKVAVKSTTLWRCVLHGSRDEYFPVRLPSPTTALCSIRSRPGSFNISLLFSESMLTNVVAAVSVLAVEEDWSVNSTALIAYEDSTVVFVSSTCNVPSSAVCVFDGEVSGTFASYPDLCTASCSSFITSPRHAVSVALCDTSACARLFYRAEVPLVHRVSLFDVQPSAGSVDGGDAVTVLGSGFTKGASVQCVFGSTVVDAVVRSEGELTCSTPASSTFQEVPLSLVDRGVVISRRPLAFQYSQFLALLSVSPTTVLAGGGNVVTVMTGVLIGHESIRCLFGDVSVYSVILNASHIQCVSPQLRLGSVEFALLGGAHRISSLVALEVVPTPTVLHFEPYHVLSNSPSNFSFHLTGSPSELEEKCYVNGALAPTICSPTSYTCVCIASTPLADGNHTIQLTIGEVPVFEASVNSGSFRIRSVFPVTGSAGRSITVTLVSSREVNPMEILLCNFGPHVSSVRSVSLFNIECATPVVDTSDIVDLPITVSGPGGTSLYTGFRFTFVTMPGVLKAAPLSGSLFGGTRLTIDFLKQIDRPVFVRIGNTRLLCDSVGEASISCLTKESIAGEFEIELSVNEIDFEAAGFSFEFLNALPVASTPPPIVAANTAILLYVNPVSVPAGAVSVIYLHGLNFAVNTVCLIGNRPALVTKYVSSEEIACTTREHAPGNDTIALKYPDGSTSSVKVITFSFQPKVTALSPDSSGVKPSSGPPAGATVISIEGADLDKIKKRLFCLIGDEWVLAFSVSASEVKCVTPPSVFTGYAVVRLGTEDRELLSGATYFEYAENPFLYDVSPKLGLPGSELQVLGLGFSRFKFLTCFIDGIEAATAVWSDSQLFCKVPDLPEGVFSVSLRTNGVNFAATTGVFEVRAPTELYSIWPVLGPSLRGSTMVTVRGKNFPLSVDISCVFGSIQVPAVVLADDSLMCRAPAHAPSLVNFSLISDSIVLKSDPTPTLSRAFSLDITNAMPLQFLFVSDVKVLKVIPAFGSILGGYLVTVFVSPLLNVTSLGCRFGSAAVRAIFLSPSVLVCSVPALSPSLAMNYSSVALEVTQNGYDFTDDNVQFEYRSKSAAGFFISNAVQHRSPNGTYCPVDSRNFTLCNPGLFQPKEGQSECLPCPVGFICPDLGMARPIICPAGFVCDIPGLRHPRVLCPMGHYCHQGMHRVCRSYCVLVLI